jgi:hypothetical protein
MKVQGQRIRFRKSEKIRAVINMLSTGVFEEK